jgi:putative peptidoglycan lipid II flippase
MIKKITPLHLWTLFFFYSLICGVIIFEFVIPNISSLHAPGSSLIPDSTYFNQVAIKLTEDIIQHGWQFWSLYPAQAAAGQSSYLAILYVFFGVHPLYAVAFNAFFHAFSGVLIYLIALEVLGVNKFSKHTAFLSASLFVSLPSAMIWVGQIHKEVCLSTGLLFALWGIMKILSNESKKNEIFGFLSALFLSVILIASMKPYMLQILAAIILTIILLQCIKIFPVNFFKFSALATYFLFTICIFMLINGYYNSRWLSGEGFIQANTNNEYSWKKSDYLPEIFDRKVQAIASSRASLISSGLAINANSMIDIDIKPANAVEVIAYAPRALQVSILVPFPNTWFKGAHIVNLVSSMEMVIFYLSFFGLLFFIFYRTLHYKILLCLIFALLPLLVLGISSPNIGTLYRVRYTFEMILVILGICGWAFMMNKLKLGKL